MSSEQQAEFRYLVVGIDTFSYETYELKRFRALSEAEEFAEQEAAKPHDYASPELCDRVEIRDLVTGATVWAGRQPPGKPLGSGEPPSSDRTGVSKNAMKKKEKHKRRKKR